MASIITRETFEASVRAAFDAGIRQGADEAVAFEWGSRPNQSRDKEFADFMADWNDDSAPIRAVINMFESGELEAPQKASEEHG
jgi:hypothetical protein